MTESEFETVQAGVGGVERAFEGCGADARVQRKDRACLNRVRGRLAHGDHRHGAAREIWVAAKSGGFHFRYDGNAWRDTRDGAELFAAVSRLASLQSGAPVVLTC